MAVEHRGWRLSRWSMVPAEHGGGQSAGTETMIVRLPAELLSVWQWRRSIGLPLAVEEELGFLAQLPDHEARGWERRMGAAEDGSAVVMATTTATG
jgi:hypothetical protein